ncbi:MAG: UvrD-helicase domain-containing protein [Actinomycetota bacterium]
MTSYDVCGPLPEGTTVLEASAGTGKTHTIASLAVRYVAEGLARIDELMLVTFGRAATVELRDRVRARMVETAAALEAREPQSRDGVPDPLFVHLLADDVETRLRNLTTALAAFDSATIATTHGFCHQMLVGLGVAADVDGHTTFLEDPRDLLGDVVADLRAAEHGGPGGPLPVLDHRTAAAVAGWAIGDPAARLEPSSAEDDAAAARYRFAVRAREAMRARKRAGHLLDWDDLLVLLRDALADPATGPDACGRVRSRYRVVMVDEFQDTDPVQWEILERAFHGNRTLVLIGDPKQAIYAFRGADVVTYLQAVGAAGTQETLGTNWRSDAPLVAALGHVWNGVPLGDERIIVHPVGAHHADRSLSGAVGAPVRIRVLDRAACRVAAPRSVTAGVARKRIARDVAEDVVRQLSGGAQLSEGVQLSEGARAEGRPLAPGDIAVIVQRNEDGRTVRDALRAEGLPVVLTGTQSVFGTAAAQQWLTLLEALGGLAQPRLARAVALTDFMGWTATQLATADDDLLDSLARTVREWASEMSERGVAALMERIWGGAGIVPRVLARDDGERDLTDLRHVGEALHAEAVRARGGVAHLTAWLRARIGEAGADADLERSRRLESDAAAVQVVTVHRAKGLEYPVVYAPFLWDRYVWPMPDPLRYHDESGTRVLDVGFKGGPDYSAGKRRHQAEEAGEQLRLAYVALTRARSQVVVHWVPTSNTLNGPLHRLLFGERGFGGSVPDQVPVPSSDDAARTHLRALAAGSGGGITVERCGDEPAAAPASDAAVSDARGLGAGRAAADAPLTVRTFDRRLDRAWARLSYTALTARAHEAVYGAEAEFAGIVDEPEVRLVEGEPEAVAPLPHPAETYHSPLGAMPGGTAFGTVVHELFEQLDFTAEDLTAALTEAAAAAGADRLGVEPRTLAAGLEPVLRTPLGALADGRALVDVSHADRLDELGFELPLAGGDMPRDGARLRGIARLLREHLPAGDVLAQYADDLAGMDDHALRGFLTGSIDLVLRVRSVEGTPRFLVVDYKTNWLGSSGPAGSGPAGGGEHPPLTAWDYRGSAMVESMRHAHYPLQALLYSVALHRFLRWRLPGHVPEQHLGGVLYLFVRGMCGPDTPVAEGMTCGVFEWSPPAALVVALSELLEARDDQ